MSQPNPFSFGNPVKYGDFLGRRREVRKVVSRLLSGGQSSALVGEPRTGKTSLLNYITAPDLREELYGDKASFFFVYFDAQTLGEQFSQPDFWSRAFIPLKEAGYFKPGKTLETAYKACSGSQFSTFMLERLLAQMATQELRLVLVIDEFDALLFHKTLNRVEFFGGLRSLASRLDSLALVIASRQSLSNLNEKTQELSRTGSPFFNIFAEIPIPSLDEKAIRELLGRAGRRFSKEDKDNLQVLAGGHPYLIQVAASELWDAYEDGERDPNARWQLTGEGLYRQIEPVLQDTWRCWSPEMKKALATIALDSMPALLDEKRFALSALAKTLSDCGSELRELKTRGFIREDTNRNLETGYSVCAEVMLWWLADQLVVALRRGDELGAWLRHQQWDGMFTAGEKTQLVKAATSLGGVMKGGVETFIKAAAEGFGKTVVI